MPSIVAGVRKIRVRDASGAFSLDLLVPARSKGGAESKVEAGRLRQLNIHAVREARQWRNTPSHQVFEVQIPHGLEDDALLARMARLVAMAGHQLPAHFQPLGRAPAV